MLMSGKGPALHRFIAGIQIAAAAVMIGALVAAVVLGHTQGATASVTKAFGDITVLATVVVAAGTVGAGSVGARRSDYPHWHRHVDPVTGRTQLVVTASGRWGRSRRTPR